MNLWHDPADRERSELLVDRGLSLFLAILVLVNFFNLNQIFDIASWEEIRSLAGFSILLACIIPLLWNGSRLGLQAIRLYYACQIPSTLALGTLYYDFDGGLKVAIGYLNSTFRFNFFFFHTNFSIGLLNSETDGTSYGLLINLVALFLFAYYSLRLNRRPLNPLPLLVKMAPELSV